MKARTLTAAATAALAMLGLSACRSNVGAAAIVNSQRISETDVARYLTARAEAVPVQNSSGVTTPVPPRSWVLEAILNDKLFRYVLAATPQGVPSDAVIASAEHALLQGTSEGAVTAQYVQHGYRPEFVPFYLRERALEQILGGEIQNGLDARSLVNRLHFAVQVNPRYGQWNATTFTLASGPGAGLPSFLTLGTTAPAPATPAGPGG